MTNNNKYVRIFHRRSVIVEIELVEKISKTLLDYEAKNIETYDISEKSELAKYIILATISDAITARKLAHELEGLTPETKPYIDGEFPGDWIVLDFNSVVVELFSEETREKYNLEKLWGDSTNKLKIKKAN